MPQKVTPWEVTGKVDYEKLIREFGTERITDSLLARLEKHAAKKGMKLHHLLRRKLFFSHRDLRWLLDKYDAGERFFLYTGRGPSGHTHIGHLVPWMLTKWLQDVFDAELYFQMTDDEKFLFYQGLELEDCTKLAYENALDVIAIGFDPEKTHIIVDTEQAELLYPLALKVAKKLTFSTTKAVFGFGNDTNAGQIFFTSMQAVPAFLPSVLKGRNIPCLIPHAIDQDAHFRVARDILPKLGFYKPAAIHCSFLPALSGPQGKMSATAPQSAVHTTDSPAMIKKKINKYAFSGGRVSTEEHRKHGGEPDVDVSYQWLRFFEEDDRKLRQIYDDYKSGKMLTGELKSILIDRLTAFLTKHQKGRQKARAKVRDYMLRA